MQKSLLIILILIFLSLSSLRAQYTAKSENGPDFYFDSIVFNTDSVNYDGEIDIFVIVPYQGLTFIKSDDSFYSEFDIIFSIYDEEGMPYKSNKVSRTLVANNFFEANGGNAGFDFVFESFATDAGKYEVKVELIDNLSSFKQSLQKTRKVGVLDFKMYDFTLSGLLVLSSIEVKEDGGYRITPFPDDNVGKLEDGFFVFFEANKYFAIDEVVLYTEILDSEDNVLWDKEPETKKIDKDITQLYVKIPFLDNIKSGEYKLRIYAYDPNEAKAGSDNKPLAVAERSISYKASALGFVYDNLDKSIAQLEYAAYKEDIIYIKNAETEKEKKERFDQFWKERDPSPRTKKNEAFIDFYSRVLYANQNFSSYAEGWLTDMGMIFIIFGPPSSVDRQSNFSDNRRVVIWRYGNNNLEFVFIDNTGFDYYRLSRPISINRKYEFGN